MLKDLKDKKEGPEEGEAKISFEEYEAFMRRLEKD